MKIILILITLLSFNLNAIEFHRIIDFMQEITEEKARPSGFCNFASPTFTTQKKTASFIFSFWSNYYNFTINYKCDEDKTLYKIECSVKVKQNDVNSADVTISDCTFKKRIKKGSWKMATKRKEIPEEIIDYLNVETKQNKPENSKLKLEDLHKNFIDIDYELGS